MTRHFRGIFRFLLAGIVILIIIWATTTDSFIAAGVKVPKLFRGQLIVTRPDFDKPQNERQRAVVAAFEHAWKNYRKFAWGHDNLKPESMAYGDWFGLGMSITDSLSTMMIMGMHEHVEEARAWVASSFRADIDINVSLFEVTIRVVGGLLSAYYLSGDDIYMNKANDVGERLLKCFTSSPTGIPHGWINLHSLEIGSNPITSIAEAGSVQMEFRALAQCTKNKAYERAVNDANEALHKLPKLDGLAYSDVSIPKAMFTNIYQGSLGVGGRVDSYYEYLLKQWIQLGKPHNHPLVEDYKNAVDGMILHLVRPTSDNVTIIGSMKDGNFDSRMEHLACYLPGTLLLGYHNGMPESHLTLANQLIESCHVLYTHNPTQLAGEQAQFDEDGVVDVSGMSYNLLRPEFVESLYYFWVYTGNSTYQEWGWDIFMAIEKYAKLEHGYTSLRNVISTNPQSMDKMETFFLAETLKYLYLLFSDDRNLIDLKQFIFTTEAHPLPLP